MEKLKTPAIFVGHGSPLNALESNRYTQAWSAIGQELKPPRAILVISAHWNISETAVSDLESPRQIYDFYGFPSELYDVHYPVQGSPAVAREVIRALAPVVKVKVNNNWGIDHGAWVPLRGFFPQAEVPVVQLSLDYNQPPESHYRIGQALKVLREQGIMIIGSGDIVHNLGRMSYKPDVTPYDWAASFEALVLQDIALNNHRQLIDCGKRSYASLAVPTPEHYLPLLYVLAVQAEDDELTYFAEGIAHGSVSMTSFILK